MGNQIICCGGRATRKRLLKTRDVAELKYEQHVLKERRVFGTMCAVSSVTGALVAVSVAAAAPSGGGSIATAAVFAVGTALQACTMQYVDETKLSDVASELRRRRVGRST